MSKIDPKQSYNLCWIETVIETMVKGKVHDP